MRWFMFNLVDTIVRSIMFGIPVAFVAQWCDVQPTWKSIAFVTFCIVWSDFVGPTEWHRSSSEPDDPSAAGNRKAAAEILTPAQVAAEAQKLTPRPLR